MRSWIDRVVDRLAQPCDFTWPGAVVLILIVVGLCALLAGILR